MNKILNEYAEKQADALTATIKLNNITDEFLKTLQELEETF